MDLLTKKKGKKNEEVRSKHKHDKDFQLLHDDGDDFVDPKPAKRRKRVGRPLKVEATKNLKSMKELSEPYPMMTSRCSPGAIFDYVKDLNNIRQREDIEALGFGHILNMKISKLPSRLACWLVRNFNPVSCELKLLDGKRLKIEESDVHRVLGLPMGGRLIESMDRSNPLLLYEQWKGMFRGIAGEEKILQKHVVEIIKSKQYENGGVWFKRHFTILLVSSLIETTTNGYIVPNTIGCLADVGSIKEWNWCEYVMRSLVTNRVGWDESAEKPAFNGPALFLMSNEKLRERQDSEIRAGGFGNGMPLEPISLEIENDDSQDVSSDEDEGCCNTVHDNVQTTSHDGDHAERELPNSVKYSEKVILTSKLIADQVVGLLKLNRVKT